MIHLLTRIKTKLCTDYQNFRLYRDFKSRKRQIEKLSKKQTLDFLIPHIVRYILQTDNYLITFRQAESLAKNYFTYFKYKDLYMELDNYTENLW